MNLSIKEKELIGNYCNLINSIQHFDDITEIDKRTFAFTAHVTNVHHLEKIRKVIPQKLNKELVDKSSSTSPNRPAVIVADDVEGSRKRNPEFHKPQYPHFHGSIVVSKQTFTAYSNLVDLRHALESAIYGIDEIRRESSLWKFRIGLYRRATSNTDTFCKDLKNNFPQIKTTTIDGDNWITATLSKRPFPNAFSQQSFLRVIQVKLPDIDTIQRIADTKTVEVFSLKPRKSMFEMMSYNMKLIGQAGNNSPTFFDFGVYPYEFDIRSIQKKSIRDITIIRATKLHDAILADPSIAFSQNYLDEFGDEFVLISKIDTGKRRKAS